MTEQAIVAIRPMRRADVAAFGAWGQHDDPLFRHYNVRSLAPAEADDFWRTMAGTPERLRPYVGLAGAVVVASLVLRPGADGTADVGIVLDPRKIGRGLGRRILAAFAEVLKAEGFRRLRLDVAGYNARAIAAYRATGFVTIDERWEEPEPGIDVEALLRGPSAAALAPYVTLAGDGRYRMRVLRMECPLDAPLLGES